MAHVIEVLNGGVHVISNERDLLDLVDEYMGDYVRRELEEILLDLEVKNSDFDDLISELEREKDHHNEVMEKLLEQSETIAGLIREKAIDREALSKAAGIIGTITWRELNAG